MKKYFRHLFLFLACTALCVACSEDDQIGKTEAIPLEIASVSFLGDVDASEDSTATRVSETSNGFSTKWSDGDEIAVQIGDGTPGRYTLSVDAEGHVTAINPTSESTQAYWPKGSGEQQTITAWYPADANTTALDMTKQGDAGLKYLAKSTVNGTPGTPVDLVFSHEFTKVWVSIAGFTNRVKSVQIYGYTSVSYTNGKVEASKPGWIPMRLKTYGDYRVYEASIAPGTFNSNNLIKVNDNVLRVPVDEVEDDYTYISNGGVDVTFMPAYIYYFDVAYLDDIYDEENHRCEVYTAEDLLVWNAGVKRDPTLGCKLMDDINMYNKKWPAICTSYDTAFRGVFEGNSLYITGLEVEISRKDFGVFAGFFGIVAPEGKVRGVMFLDSYVHTATNEDRVSYLGTVAGYNCGAIQACSVVGTVVVNNAEYVGGIAGMTTKAGSKVEACWTNMFGMISDDKNDVYGHIVGVARSSTNVLYCYSSQVPLIGGETSDANIIVGTANGRTEWADARDKMNSHIRSDGELIKLYYWYSNLDDYQVLTLKER